MPSSDRRLRRSSTPLRYPEWQRPHQAALLELDPKKLAKCVEDAEAEIFIRLQQTERDKELVGLVAVGLTDDEIATQLQIPKHKVLKHIARVLAKLGARDRVEIVLHAYSDPVMYERISSETINRTTKNPQAQTPRVKQKAS